MALYSKVAFDPSRTRILEGLGVWFSSFGGIEGHFAAQVHGFVNR